MTPLVHYLLFFYDDNIKKLNQFCSRRPPLFVYSSLYRALKLTFLFQIGGLSLDDTIKSEIGYGSIRQAVDVLTPAAFNVNPQP